MDASVLIIRKTTSVCPVCFRKLNADIVERNHKVYMDKECEQHGRFELLLSEHPSYYRQLSEFYFAVMKNDYPQRDYIVHLTNKCNISCPICLISSNARPSSDYPIKKLADFLKGRRGHKIDLMGAEPTMREDLDEIIRLIKSSGNIAALHTNGIKIADFSYLQMLQKAGLQEVHLQLDGFDDSVYERIRGEKLLKVKLAALENLERLDIATDLVVTVMRNVNEQEMRRVLDYGITHGFVKEIFFLGCRYLGNARDLPVENCMMPDELIDILEKQTQGVVLRDNVLLFQKLYFALLAAFGIRKCYYIQHFIVARNKGGFTPVDRFFDLQALQADLERFRVLLQKSKIRARMYLLYALAKQLLHSPLEVWKEFFSFGLPFVRGFDLSQLPRKTILLGFISACDPYSLDDQIASLCGKGALSLELGIQESGAIDNVLREKLYQEAHT